METESGTEVSHIVQTFSSSRNEKKIKICKLFISLQQTFVREGFKEDNNSYFLSLLALLTSKHANEESLSYICYLLSFYIEKVPSRYVYSNMKLLLTSFCDTIDRESKIEFILQKIIPSVVYLLIVNVKKALDNVFMDGIVRIFNLFSQNNHIISKHLSESLVLLMDTIAMSRSVSKTFSEFIFCNLLREIELVKTSGSGHDAIKITSMLKLTIRFLEDKEIIKLNEAIVGFLTRREKDGVIYSRFYELLYIVLRSTKSLNCADRYYKVLMSDVGSRTDPYVSPRLTICVLQLIQKSQLNADQKYDELFRLIDEGISSDDSRTIESTRNMLFAVISQRYELEKSHISSINIRIMSLLRQIHYWRYKNFVPHIFDIMMSFIQQYADEMDSYIYDILSFAECFKDHKDFGKGSEDIFSLCISICHPGVVLHHMPLCLDRLNDSRDWLIPMLRKNIRITTLAYFFSHLNPISETLYTLHLECKEEGKEQESFVYLTRFSQLLNLLPTFISHCNDFDSGFIKVLNLFPLLSRIEDGDIVALNSISASINIFPDSVVLKQNVEIIIEYLLGLFHTPGYQKKDLVIKTMKLVFEISGTEMVDMFRRGLMEDVTKMNIYQEMDKKDENRTVDLLNLLLTVIPSLTKDSLLELFIFLSKNYKCDNLCIRKLIYKLLYNIISEDKCVLSNASYSDFVLEFIDYSMENKFYSKFYYMICCVILKKIPCMEIHYLKFILHEVIMSFRGVNSKVSNIAKCSLVVFGRRLVNREFVLSDKEESQLRVYVELILDHLLSDSTTIYNASLDTLSVILCDLCDSFSHDDIESLLVFLLNFGKSDKIRGVSKSFTRLLRIIVSRRFHKEVVEKRLKGVLSVLLDMQLYGVSRSIIKNIIRKCINIYGEELVRNNCPPEHQRLLSYMKKEESKKRKTSKVSEEDDGLEDTAESTNIYVSDEDIEGISDDDLDLLDRSVTTKHLGNSCSDSEEHEVENDGRLIIHDDKALKNTQNEQKLASIQTPNRQKQRDKNMASQRKRRNIYRDLEIPYEHTGEMYRSQKSGGDVHTRDNQYKPFSYVPLSRKLFKNIQTKNKMKALYHK